MIDAILKALQDATAGDLLAYAGVWIGGPLVTFWWVNQVKRDRRRQGRPLTGWEMRCMASMIAALMAMFVGHRMAGWPLDKAINNAVAVGFCFPLLITVILDKLQRIAPDIADDVGSLPTEFRGADTVDLTKVEKP